MKVCKVYTAIAMFLITVTSEAVTVDGVLDWSEPEIRSFSSQGIIEKVTVHTGAKLKKNQLLAQLDRRSLKAVIEKNKATVQQFAPLIFDARIEFNNAKELFDRTVLSEIDLQKKQGVLKELEARQAAAQADLDLAKIQYSDALLKSPYDARLVQNNMLPGMVISAENMSATRMLLVPIGKMWAIVTMHVEQAVNIALGQQVRLTVNGNQHIGSVISSTQLSSQSERYIVGVEFGLSIEHNYLAGQTVTVEF